MAEEIPWHHKHKVVPVEIVETGKKLNSDVVRRGDFSDKTEQAAQSAMLSAIYDKLDEILIELRNITD